MIWLNFNESDFKAFNYEFAGDTLFDGEYYFANNADVRDAGLNPFTQFMEVGVNEGRSPSKGFDQPDVIVASAELSPGVLNDLRSTNTYLAQSIYDPIFDPIEEAFNNYIVLPVLGVTVLFGKWAFDQTTNAWEFLSEEVSPFIAIDSEFISLTFFKVLMFLLLISMMILRDLLLPISPMLEPIG